MSLAFDPAKSSDCYKVVCVCQLKWITAAHGFQYQIEIYSPGNPGAWSSSVLEPFIAHVVFSNGVYWNNAIYWISLWGRESLYFNIHHQVLEQMPNPPVSRVGYVRRSFYFGESCDHLHYIQIFGEEIQFDVYEMKRDYFEWFVKYRVDLSLVLPANPRAVRDRSKRTYWHYAAFCILSIVRGDQDGEDASFLVLQIQGKAIRYNIIHKTFEKVHEFKDEFVDEPGDLIRFQHINGFQYIESLCSI